MYFCYDLLLRKPMFWGAIIWMAVFTVKCVLFSLLLLFTQKLNGLSSICIQGLEIDFYPQLTARLSLWCFSETDWFIILFFSHCISQILESVNHIHQHDIVHRDLKVSTGLSPQQPHTLQSGILWGVSMSMPCTAQTHKYMRTKHSFSFIFGLWCILNKAYSSFDSFLTCSNNYYKDFVVHFWPLLCFLQYFLSCSVQNRGLCI